MVECVAVEIGEGTAHQHPPIELDCQRPDNVGSPCAGIKTRVQRAVRIEPGNAVALDVVDGRKAAADEDLASLNRVRGVNGDRIDGPVNAQIGVERAVQQTGVVKTRKSGAAGTVHVEKTAANEQPAIGHKSLRQRKNRVVAARAGIERGV